MVKNRKFWTLIALVCVIMLGAVGCNNGKPVAKINGKPLSEATYRAYLFTVKMQMEQGFGPQIWEIEMEGESMEKVAKESALESAVAMSVTSKKAKEMKLELTKEEKEEAEQIAKNYVEQFKEPLSKQGVTENIMKALMEEIIMSQKVVEALSDQFVPTDDPEAFASFVEENKTHFEQATAQHILIASIDEERNPLPEAKLEEAKEKANMVLEKALAGEDMGKLAKEYSEDPGSKDSNGEYTFPRGQMVAEFEEVAFNGEEGKVFPELVETMHGYHIIKPIARKDADEAEMKSVFEEDQKIAYVNGEIEELIKAADVEKTDVFDKITLKEEVKVETPDTEEPDTEEPEKGTSETEEE